MVEMAYHFPSLKRVLSGAVGVSANHSRTNPLAREEYSLAHKKDSPTWPAV
jgi:hypothetical protein